MEELDMLQSIGSQSWTEQVELVTMLSLLPQACLTPWTVKHGLPSSCPWVFSKNTGGGYHSLLQIFPTQRSNPYLPIAGAFFTVSATGEDPSGHWTIALQCSFLHFEYPYALKSLRANSNCYGLEYSKNLCSKCFKTHVGLTVILYALVSCPTLWPHRTIARLEILELVAIPFSKVIFPTECL